MDMDIEKLSVELQHVIGSRCSTGGSMMLKDKAVDEFQAPRLDRYSNQMRDIKISLN